MNDFWIIRNPEIHNKCWVSRDSNSEGPYTMHREDNDMWSFQQLLSMGIELKGKLLMFQRIGN